MLRRQGWLMVPGLRVIVVLALIVPSRDANAAVGMRPPVDASRPIDIAGFPPASRSTALHGRIWRAPYHTGRRLEACTTGVAATGPARSSCSDAATPSPMPPRATGGQWSSKLADVIP